MRRFTRTNFYAQLAFLCLVMLTGCASLKAIDLNAVKADVKGDAQAVKTGDVMPLKGNVHANADIAPQASVGYQNSTQKQDAGRDITTSQQKTVTNDTGLMKAALGGLGSIVIALIGYVRILSKQRAQVEARLLTLIDKQEESQSKYIKMLEDIARSVLETKGVNYVAKTDGVPSEFVVTKT